MASFTRPSQAELLFSGGFQDEALDQGGQAVSHMLRVFSLMVKNNRH